MTWTRKIRTIVMLALVVAIAASDTGLAKPKKKKQIPTGTPVLWRRPVDIQSRDLFLGPGGAGMRPDLRRITFIKGRKGWLLEKVSSARCIRT